MGEGIQLHVEPRQVMTWEEFVKERPPYSVALDGFVKGESRRQLKPPYANFDHHLPDYKDWNPESMMLRATCDQVQMEIEMGLMDIFRKDGEPHMHIHVNDPDEDTSLAVWLLRNHERVQQGDADLSTLVHWEDRLDVTAGAFPVPQQMLEKMAWIFEPYRVARHTQQLEEMGGKGMEDIIDRIGGRIDKYIAGESGRLPLKEHFEVIGGGHGWSLIKETGHAARLGALNSGIQVFASVISENDDGTFRYVIGKSAPWVDYDIQALKRRLNEEEKVPIDEKNSWGGTMFVIGSPRGTGSGLDPDELSAIIDSTYAAMR